MPIKITNIIKSTFKQAYGIKCAFLNEDHTLTHLYPTFCSIPKKQATISHDHEEPELFYIINGEGLITIDKEIQQVKTGDIILIPSGSTHQLQNITDQELHFLSVYCKLPQPPAASYLITTAPPTPNGPLHLGHISGPYLAGDILRRALELANHAVKTNSGTDDHQNYVHSKADALGLSTEKFSDQMHSKIRCNLKKFKIHYNRFLQPQADLNYQQQVLQFCQRAIDKGVLTKKIMEMPYCINCHFTLVDSLIEGNCSHCQTICNGVCENCGMVTAPYRLNNACCARCKTPAHFKLGKVYVFELIKYLPLIKDKLQNVCLPERAHNLINKILTLDRLEMVVAYQCNTQYGLTLPRSGLIIHVWLEMAATYEAYALQSHTWINCFGFDNSFYFLLFIPALLIALNKKAKFPEVVIVNDYLMLNNQKFSTSRRNAIWVDDFKGNVEHLRLYLSLYSPQFQASNFCMNDFINFSLKLEQQLTKLYRKIQYRDHTKGLLARCSSCLLIKIKTYLSPQTFNLGKACKLLLDFLDLLSESKFKLACNASIHCLGTAMLPFMPQAGARLLEQLSRKNNINQKPGNHEVLANE